MSTAYLLIGIRGLAHHGKDTVCQFIQDYLSRSRCQRLSLADPLKQIVSILTDIPIDDIDRNKKTQLPEYGMMTLRCLMQKVGTEALRGSLGEDVWVNLLRRRMRSLPPGQVVVIPDVRFENEMRFIRSERGIMIGVHRPELQLDENIYGHVSEIGQLSLPECDYLLTNDGSPEDLRNRVYELMSLLCPGEHCFQHRSLSLEQT